MTTQITLTELEKKVLEGINNSHYGDELGHGIWAWSINCSVGKKSIPGVVSSLSKKGLVKCWDTDDDAVIAITETGITVCKEHNLLGKYK